MLVYSLSNWLFIVIGPALRSITLRRLRILIRSMISKLFKNGQIQRTSLKDPLQAGGEVFLRSNHGDGAIMGCMCREIRFELNIGECSGAGRVGDEWSRWVGEAVDSQFCVISIR
jgi:hypothetical protein